VYTSELTKRRVGNYPGIVQASLIDLDRFVPSASKPSNSSGSAGFTVGRLSKANPFKHHPDDAALYRQLADRGCRVRIMGPSPSLKAELVDLEAVTLLPAYAQEAHLFLQGLDCFFYRTSENFLEPSGRVITEAMACGLAVVCHKRGGYAEIIDDGHNGFLFDTQQEALEIVLSSKKTQSCARGSARRRDVQQKSFSLMPYARRSSSSTCVDDQAGHHRELPEQRREQREGVLSNFLNWSRSRGPEGFGPCRS